MGLWYAYVSGLQATYVGTQRNTSKVYSASFSANIIL